MNRRKVVHTLADFQKQTRQHVLRLKRTGEPEVLTLNGRPQVVVQSAKAYGALLERADLADTVRILRKRAGEAAGDDISADQVLKEIRSTLGLEDPR